MDASVRHGHQSQSNAPSWRSRHLSRPDGERGRRPDELTRARAELRARLEERRDEIEREALTRVDAIADSADVADPAYAQGLRSAVAVAFDYALEAIERGEERAPPPPAALLDQARLAARSGVGLDTVLRRYFAGYALLGDLLAHEAEAGRFPTAPAGLLGGLAAVFDRLIAAVSQEYARVAESRTRSAEHRRVERVQRLLAGEPLGTSDIPYDFDRHHVGLVAEGPRAVDTIRELAGKLDARLLIVRRDEAAAWAWFGTRRPLDPVDVERTLLSAGDARCLALGEPAAGLAGWRLTHRQAAAAFPIASRGRRPVRYADVALLAAALKDDLLATSLRRLYLEPLRGGPDGGATAKEILCAYFASDRNLSSAAATLGVNRNTVARHLRAIETALGRPLSSCGPELQVALRLAEAEVPAPR